MRAADEIRTDIVQISQGIDRCEYTSGLLRRQFARLFKEARDHPELPMEEARAIPETTVSRRTAYELAKEAK